MNYLWHQYFVKNSKRLADYITYKYQGTRVYYDIINADAFDYKLFEPKKDCLLFRVVGFAKLHQSIVCINTDRNLIYFMDDYTDENSTWNTRGIKIDFPVLITP